MAVCDDDALRYIVVAREHRVLNAEGSHNGSAAVLKTAGRKAMQVRVLSPPPFPAMGFFATSLRESSHLPFPNLFNFHESSPLLGAQLLHLVPSGRPSRTKVPVTFFSELQEHPVEGGSAMENGRAKYDLDGNVSDGRNALGDQGLGNSPDKPRSGEASRASEIFRFSFARVAIFVALLGTAASFFIPGIPTFSTLTAQQDARRAGAWLDRPLVNWNFVSNGLPTPISPVQSQELQNRCPNLVRQVESPSEREIVDAGWLLYGPLQSYGPTKVITAMSDADDMCRPLGHQAFVYSGSTYAGTLSPVAMDSLTNGDLSTIRLVSATSISAEFARYREDDVTGRPTRISYVTYEVSIDESPLVSPVARVTKPLCTQEPELSESPASNVARLFEVKWILVEIRGVPVRANNPDITFGHSAKIFSSQGGCNRIVGRFEVEGTSLTFSGLVGTRLACLDNDAQQLEMDFIKALEQTTHFQLQDDVLSFSNSDSQLLVFRPYADQAAQ